MIYFINIFPIGLFFRILYGQISQSQKTAPGKECKTAFPLAYDLHFLHVSREKGLCHFFKTSSFFLEIGPYEILQGKSWPRKSSMISVSSTSSVGNEKSF